VTRERRGLVIVNTGDGKGKTTAALGVALRARGHGYSVIGLQFIKSAARETGERAAARALGFDLIPLGDGFTWLSKDAERTVSLALEAWDIAKGHILSGAFDVVILDELTYALQYGWVDTAEVIATLAARPAGVHVVITGRGAPEALIAAADLVTEMRPVKHPFQAGIPAQEGVDF